MNQNKRTLVFVIVAVVSVGIALLSNVASKPRSVAGFEKVGQEFYPDFKDPNVATALRVVTYSEDTASAKPFIVEFKDGAWRIPSHHNYPADGKDQLAKTAASVIGITRGGLAGRRESDHERFGVVDPLDETTATLTGRGHRITLFDKSENVLVDFIVGKKLGDGGDEYYVRRADEKETYRTKLDLKVSTKFADWVESDLLKFDRNSLVKLRGSRPVVSPLGQITGEEAVELTRKTSSDDWKLDGLKEETEELKKSDISSMEWALDDLKLVGVRPKPKHGENPLLTADLRFDPPEPIARNSQLKALVLEQLKDDLASRGFFLGPDRNDPKKTSIYSREGELVASTNKGVVYHLHFGNVFSGTEEEIEIGKSKGKDEESQKEGDSKKDKEAKSQKAESDAAKSDNKEDADKTAGEDSAADKDKDAESKDDKDDDSASKLTKSRYLFVRASFDEAMLGDKPTEPAKPGRPEGLDDKAAKEVEDKVAGKTEEKKEAEEKSDESKKDDSEKAEKEDPKKKEYEEALQKYEDDQKKYEGDLKDFEKKVEDGKKTVKELNDRFADWYYVISEKSFEDLCLARADLVKPKEKKDEDKAEKKDEDSSMKESSAAKKAETPAEEKKEEKKSEKPAETAKAKPESDKKDMPPEQPKAKPAPEKKASTEPAPPEKKAAPSEEAKKEPEPKKEASKTDAPAEKKAVEKKPEADKKAPATPDKPNPSSSKTPPPAAADKAKPAKEAPAAASSPAETPKPKQDASKKPEEPKK